MVAGTNTFDAKLSGMMIRNMIPCTAPDVRTFIPTNTDTQDSDRANSDGEQAARDAR